MADNKPTPTDDRRLSEQLGAVAEPTRLRIIRLLTSGPRSVGQIADGVKVEMVNASHHLRLLTRAGVLTDTKKGRHVEYRFADGVFEPATGGPHLGTLHLDSCRLTIEG
ncbi:ArsR family transcriptional regulator [Limnoglobus roseus]|uniref:ArsR family transcriptional regulator n=2 Tax=Limnoglobus roseus TaxID=2598579 RepID=A0A5C1AI86_9BACT|nr:ArsR family transcriptional regulator [Limnoglobus roseus]